MNHTFNVAVATKIGVNEAIVLAHIDYWIERNYRLGREQHNGKYWMFESVAAMAEYFPYFTERQVRYALQSLLNHGLIEKGVFNRVGFDRTSWYTITEKGRLLLNE